ncbi:glycosyltransferase family 2 protein [Methanobacterium sp. CWC-01]|uniref:glycosyltransferase family 2 protein n=1 Tax=Methanobacterium aridiramus TaxID=2584467 RepID=UPI00257570EE|nr:glycosyltransferase family A protein [Methanobacterium sp. CWC-01]WJI10169.1 glycosyltransferase family 2 protein [Methanobacterium sp. CWC-01]
MISLVCVYNNKDILETYLLKSLITQSQEYELILIDNHSEKFNSAAEALNYGGKKATGQYLMFAHQDFQLDSDIWLEEAEEILKNLDHLGVAGVAGRYGRDFISNIKTGFPPKFAGKIQIKEPQKVQTLDECLFIIPKKIFKDKKFDEITCGNWHLYATDYCLTVKNLGYDVFVIPMGGYHASPGYSFTPDGYYSTLKKLIKKHKAHYKWIYTTTGIWNTVLPLDLQILYQKTYYWLDIDRLK